MNQAQLVALLERERVSYPDELPGERLAPVPAERICGRLPAYTPITERRAEQNYHRLARALNEQDTD